MMQYSCQLIAFEARFSVKAPDAICRALNTNTVLNKLVARTFNCNTICVFFLETGSIALKIKLWKARFALIF